MKKLLSLLSVLTISGTAVPTTIAASPYQKEKINSDINYQQINNLENLRRNKRSTENDNYKKEYFNDIDGYVIYHYNKKYFYDSFDLTDLYGYSDGNKFKNDFNFFEIKNANVDFYRHDNKESIKINNTLIKGDIKNMKYQDEFNENIENNISPTMYPSGKQGYKGASIDDFPFIDPGKSSISVFNESLKNILTYHQGKIEFAMQKYLKNNHLMLRIIYRFGLNTAGSSTGASLKLSTQGYKFY